MKLVLNQLKDSINLEYETQVNLETGEPVIRANYQFSHEITLCICSKNQEVVYSMSKTEELETRITRMLQRLCNYKSGRDDVTFSIMTEFGPLKIERTKDNFKISFDGNIWTY